MRAGELRERFEFQERSPVSDGHGNEQGPWQARYECAGRRQMLRGGEQVMASRLEGRQPAVITIRANRMARRITTDWRARDIRSEEIWAIRSISLSEKRDFLDLLVERGVATN
jgi:head-tail adaptor